MVVKKVVCFRCVIEPDLERRIKRSGVSAPCSLCGVTRKCIPLAQVTAQVEAVLGKYICEGEHHRYWSGNELRHGQQGDYVEYWVSEIFGCDNIEPIVQVVCDDFDGQSYSRDTSYIRMPFLPYAVERQWHEFGDGVRHGNRYFNDSAKKFLGWLFEGLDSYSCSSRDDSVVRILTPEDAPPIYRARSCTTSDAVESISRDPASNLAAPPKEKSGEGRMNPAGVPAFYGAFERETCVAELRPPVGGTVISGEFRLTREVRLLDFGRFEKADLGQRPSFFDPQYFEKSGRQEFLRDLHNEITVPVLPGFEKNYLITQVVAEYLATQYDPRFDGVIFKSVQNEGGHNIVLFSHVACAATSTIVIKKDRGFVLGPKSSSVPGIEYVPDSLSRHAVKGVKFDMEEEPLAQRDSSPLQIRSCAWE